MGQVLIKWSKEGELLNHSNSEDECIIEISNFFFISPSHKIKIKKNIPIVDMIDPKEEIIFQNR